MIQGGDFTEGDVSSVPLFNLSFICWHTRYVLYLAVLIAEQKLCLFFANCRELEASVFMVPALKMRALSVSLQYPQFCASSPSSLL